jgi:phospholipase/lecithinase/hemolysin
MAAAAAVVDGIKQLSGEFDNFLVFTLPPLDQTPAFKLLNPLAQPLAEAGTLAFNNTLAAGLSGLDSGLKVTTIDMPALFALLFANPGAYGLTNVTQPCFVPQTGSFFPGCVPDEWAFYDPVHPNRVVHEALAVSGVVSATVVSASVDPEVVSELDESEPEHAAAVSAARTATAVRRVAVRANRAWCILRD